MIALADVLQSCNWAKRVLFLADRVALVNQAANAFNTHLPASSPVNLVLEKEDAASRVYLSTYPTMMGLIDDLKTGARRFGVGHFDLVVIDEAHRSVYQKYGAIFTYFDSLLVGLTATPKSEVDKNTYRLFDLESGVPTFAYELEQAVAEGYLVPPRSVSVPLKFQREGIKYDELSEDEQEEWDAKDWGETEEAPDQVEATAVNKWLFNEDTVDKVLEHLMTSGLKVDGGDRLGKTIIFAKNHDHAVFIQQRFDRNYPHLKGRFARVIDNRETYAQNLIDDFSTPDKAPHIAISVDMLDTGIDVPEVVHLVLFKLVRSRTKFWQMIGRGTRLRADLFGPGKHKEFFFVFDYCQNFEYFGANAKGVEGSVQEPLSKKLFLRRLELLQVVRKETMSDALSMDAVHEPATSYMSLDAHREHPAVLKLRFNEPMTTADVESLEDLLYNLGGEGSQDQFEHIYGKTESLGAFIRKLVGLDREAASKAFGKHLTDTQYNATQIRFIHHIIEYLTKNGVMDAGLLYEQPFTNFSPLGLDGLFPDHAAADIVQILAMINKNAGLGIQAHVAHK